MEIAVTTPAGHVGQHLVRHLLHAGVTPRVLTRSPDRLPPALQGYVRPYAVDLRDGTALRAALDGVEAWYLVSPDALTHQDPVAAHEHLGRVAAAAALEAGVARTVFQSSVGAERRDGVGEIDGLARIERSLDEALVPAGRGVTHLRCGYFMSNLVQQLPRPDEPDAEVIRVLLPTDHPLPFVAPQDVGAVAAALLLRPDWTGRRVQAVHGPADLSWDEVAHQLGRALGRPLEARRVDDDEVRAELQSAGLGPDQVEAVVGMSTGTRPPFEPEQPRDVRTTTATSLTAWGLTTLV